MCVASTSACELGGFDASSSDEGIVCLIGTTQSHILDKLASLQGQQLKNKTALCILAHRKLQAGEARSPTNKQFAR